MDWKRYAGLAKRTDQSQEGYRKAVERIIGGNLPVSPFHLLVSSLCWGLNAGEAMDRIKKATFYGKEGKPRSVSYKSDDVDGAKARLSGDGIRYLHAALGLVTESAELLEAVLKGVTSPEGFDKVNLAEEAGDLTWYMAILLDTLDIPIEQILETNIAKLKARYKERFSEEEAQVRDLNAEREVVERRQEEAKQSAGLREITDAENWRALVEEVRRLDGLVSKPSGHLTDTEVKIITYRLLQRETERLIQSQAPIIKVNEAILNQVRDKMHTVGFKPYKPGSQHFSEGSDPVVQDAINERVQDALDQAFREVSKEIIDSLPSPFPMGDKALRSGLAAIAAREICAIPVAQRGTADEIGATTPPARYNHGEREAIDEIRDALGDELFAGFCAGQVIKYRYRHGAKPGDAEKLAWYGKMLNHLSDAEPDPRSDRPNFQPYECPGVGSGNKWWHRLQMLEKYGLTFGGNGRLLAGPLHKI